MAPALPMMVLTVAAIMLPSVVPAIAHRNQESGAAALASAFGFTGSYVAVWALAAAAIWAVYTPPGDTTAGAVLAEKLLPPIPAIDVPIAFATAGAGLLL